MSGSSSRQGFRNLGRDYVVGDKSGGIRSLKRGCGDVFARFRLEADAIERARFATAGGDKHEPTFCVDAVDRSGETIAVADKTVHIRRLSGGAGRVAA